MIQRDSWRLWAMAGVLASGAAAGQPHAHARSDPPDFAPHRLVQNLGPSSQLERLIPTDVDGDGDLDLVGCGQLDEDVFWLENRGRLQFLHHLIAPITSPNALTAEDINLDGRPDILVAGSLHGIASVFLLENLGGSPVTFAVREAAPLAFISDMFVADLDSDGDRDFLSARFIGEPLFWHEHVADNFSDHSLGWGPISKRPTCLVVDDLNADSCQDILLGMVPSAPHTLLWLRREKGPNVAFQPVPLLDGGLERLVNAALVDDLNSDGVPDIVYAQPGFDRVALLINSPVSPGAFTTQILTTDPDGPSSGMNGPIEDPIDLKFADIDIDGRQDIVFIGSTADQVGWFRRMPGTSPAYELQLIASDPDGSLGPLEGFSNRPVKCSVGDIDGDGDIDILVTSLTDRSHVLWENRLLCREDIDGSGLIDFGDVNAVVGAFNTAQGEPGFDADADLDGDGFVGFTDLNVLLSFFNSTCGAVSR